MQLFQCQRCGQSLYFENVRCESCGSELGYLPSPGVLSALERGEGDARRPLALSGTEWRYCANRQENVCNWMVPAEGGGTFCLACQLNRTIPNLGDARERERWRRLESVKHRLVYTLLRLGLPVTPKAEGSPGGLAFDFLGHTDQAFGAGKRPMTGHLNGLITIDTAEADPAERERRRARMAEPYRTLAGHFRHEIGHYYWAILFSDEAGLERFRAVFGDERRDYGAAIEAHHQSGAPANWQGSFVSAYASAHPWEDWAETWAHLLHIIDTMETAAAFGVSPGGQRTASAEAGAGQSGDPYREADFDQLIERWLPLTYAVNSLNRSMGQPDLYPFVLSPGAIEKLRFVHRMIRGFGG